MATAAIPKNKILGGSFLLEERQTVDVFTPEDFSEQHQMIALPAAAYAVGIAPVDARGPAKIAHPYDQSLA